ncbi:membrane protein [Microlunatus endophyticus]|uniref:Membrane protein n=1 Tax=Microlunatus endophyticus TaxID=1716077 RepID=A0A917SC04_9ACTN|nr:YibE/F family protein [Microlunatus endophyticus]GGL66008.1 membrane protein [Microlunatus endophyticus]
MSHLHVDDHPRTAGSEIRRVRALRLMIVVLIPIAIWTVVGLIWLWPGNVSAHVQQDVSQYSVKGMTIPTGRITKVEEVSCQGKTGSTPGQADQNGCANLTVRVLNGVDEGKQVQVTLTQAQFSSGASVGQKVKLFRLPGAQGQPATFQFSDFDRGLPLIVLAIAFAAVVVVVARWRGFAALVGLAFAGFILVEFMFPALVSGTNPLLAGLIGSSAIMFVVLYAAHGFSTRTTTALIGTLFGLLLTAGLGWGVTRWAHLTGVATEDDYLLAASAPDMTLSSVVLCGIIVAGLGVLNDVTITQASAVWELAESDPHQKNLFARAMRIGRDHVASSVYTIAFATAGAGLAALLLITVYGLPLHQVAQTEALSEEIIRTLVGAIGLVLAMPLTTLIGVAVVRAGGVGEKKPAPTPASAAAVPVAGAAGATRESPRVPVRPMAATTAPMDDRETTMLPRIRRAAQSEQPEQPEPAARIDQPREAAAGTGSDDQRRRSRRARQDDESFNFTDLRADDDDDDDQPRGRRWR